MKTLNAKRITAIAAGAALLGIGLAVAGPVTFGNLPIISNSGQPLWQIVVGHAAQPSDGVDAANLAATIGNLAYTSVPVTATVNATQAKSVLGVQVTSASYTLTNQQVWLNVSGISTATGTYGFTALIGSVLNKAIISGSPQYTKALQTAASGYAYTDNSASSYNLNNNPAQSPYTPIGGPSTVVTTFPTVTTGGGVVFSSFSVGTGTGDNILQITNAQLPALLNNAGKYAETESLWMTGFPVFQQYNATGKVVNRFAVLGMNGAYQITFNKPIDIVTSTGSVNQASFTMLGQNWTILSYNAPTAKVPASGNVIFGSSKIQLAASLSPLTTVYVGQNLSSGPFTIQLTDLGQPANGVSPASINLYYNGVLQPGNTSQIMPGVTKQFNVSGHNLYVKVNSTFAGLYAYQKWAKIQLYSNVYNLTNQKTFNQTNDKNWWVLLGWTNQTGATSGNADSLSTIIIYGTAQQQTNLTQGQSFTWISNPAAWKVTFGGDTLGSNYDPVTFVSTYGSETYANGGTGKVAIPESAATGGGAWAPATGAPANQLTVNATAITDPAEQLVVTSKTGQFSGFGTTPLTQLLYDLTPYALTVYNTINTTQTSGQSYYVTLSGASVANFMTTATSGLKTEQVTLSVNTSTSGTAVPLTPLTFNSGTLIQAEPTAFMGVDNIGLSRALPGLTVTVNAVSGTHALLLATLTPASTIPLLLLPAPTHTGYNSTAGGVNVQYNQLNGQVQSNFTLAQAATANAGSISHAGQFFVYNALEYPVPYSTTYNDLIQFGLVNNTAGIGSEPFFILNYSAVAAGSGSDHGQFNNITYVPSAGTSAGTPQNIVQGFKTEKGSTVTSISSTTVGVNFARAVDTLLLTVGAISSNSVTSHYTICPGVNSAGIGVGQSLSTCGINNVSIYAVTGNVAISGKSNFTISGINNIQATPSVSSATTPVLLKGLSGAAPLVVLDSAANAGSNLILIGSGFVNSLSAALQTAYNVSITSPSSPVIMQAYGNNRILLAGYTANQTTQAVDGFINQLYASAST